MKIKIRPSIILTQENSILLLRYNYNGNIVYAIPGGNIDTKENLKDTVKRELYEELFLEVSVEKLCFVAETFLEEKQTLTLHNIFYGKIEKGIPTVNANETTAECFEWVDINNLDKINTYPNIGTNIKQLLQNNNSDVYLGRLNQIWF